MRGCGRRLQRSSLVRDHIAKGDTAETGNVKSTLEITALKALYCNRKSSNKKALEFYWSPRAFLVRRVFATHRRQLANYTVLNIAPNWPEMSVRQTRVFKWGFTTPVFARQRGGYPPRLGVAWETDAPIAVRLWEHRLYGRFLIQTRCKMSDTCWNLALYSMKLFGDNILMWRSCFWICYWTLKANFEAPKTENGDCER